MRHGAHSAQFAETGAGRGAAGEPALGVVVGETSGELVSREFETAQRVRAVESEYPNII